ncbi:MAG: ABC transporter permease subunit, partial [Emcibacteraceae bacterium]|nr:ABC transporter permease subunit [Emcibacteraceae bacterium]
MIHKIATIVQKEVKDSLRDPGAIIAALLYTFIGPAIVLTIMSFLSNNLGSDRDPKVYADIQGGTQSNTFLQFLSDNSINDQDTSSIKVIIPNDFDEQLKNGDQGTIVIKADLGKHGITVNTIRTKINSYGNIIIKERLAPYDLNTNDIRPIAIALESPENTSVLGKSLISLITLSFCMAVAFTGMSLSIDMTVGERERLTLEPLLAQPITPLEIIAGKWTTSIIMALIGCGFTAILLTIIFATSSYTTSDLEFNFNGFTAFKIFVYLIPMCALFSSIQIAIALFAKTYKEGIYYLSLSGVGPMAASFMDAEITAKLNFLPI